MGSKESIYKPSAESRLHVSALYTMQDNQRGQLDHKPETDHLDEAVELKARGRVTYNGDDAAKALEGWVTIVTNLTF